MVTDSELFPGPGLMFDALNYAVIHTAVSFLENILHITLHLR